MKTIPVESIPEIKDGGIKDSCGEGKFKHNIFTPL
jgi:hypothetical protein